MGYHKDLLITAEDALRAVKPKTFALKDATVDELRYSAEQGTYFVLISYIDRSDQLVNSKSFIVGLDGNVIQTSSLARLTHQLEMTKFIPDLLEKIG